MHAAVSIMFDCSIGHSGSGRCGLIVSTASLRATLRKANISTAVHEKLKHLLSELRQLDLELRSEEGMDSLALYSFRESLDSVRLRAWSKAELMSARSAEKDPNSIVTYLVSERLRRFEWNFRGLTGRRNPPGTTSA